MSKAPSRYRRLRWRWFWVVFIAILAAYVGLSTWTYYQVQRWNMRARSLFSAAAGLQDPNPPAVIAAIGQPTSSTQDGSQLVFKYGPPGYPLGLEFRFVSGRLANRNAVAFARWHTHPVARVLAKFGEIALGISLPLWLALGIGTCFRHAYTRALSHLLLATACLILVLGVAAKPVSPGPWFLGTVAVVVGALAVRFSYRIPKDGAAPACNECGYNLTGNLSGICPECGTPVPAEIRARSSTAKHHNEVRGNP